jgi:hypothetical protein
MVTFRFAKIGGTSGMASIVGAAFPIVGAAPRFQSAIKNMLLGAKQILSETITIFSVSDKMYFIAQTMVLMMQKIS